MYYYQHHIGDFIRDTSRLNDSQSMAYLRLMWIYYETESPLPDDPKKLAFQIGASADDVALILDHFFDLDANAMRTHKRIEREILAYRSKREKAQSSANARWSNANALRTQSERNANAPVFDANQEPRTNNQEQIKKQSKKTPQAAPPDGVSSETWLAFVDLRKKKRAPITELVLSEFNREAEKAGWPLENAIRECCIRGWAGFKAEWVNKSMPSAKHGSMPTVDDGQKRNYGESGLL